MPELRAPHRSAVKRRRTQVCVVEQRVIKNTFIETYSVQIGQSKIGPSKVQSTGLVTTRPAAKDGHDSLHISGYRRNAARYTSAFPTLLDNWDSLRGRGMLTDEGA